MINIGSPIQAVAGYLVREREIFLAVKKQKVGAGLYMPYGGKVGPYETHEDAMLKELRQECGVISDPCDLEKVGVLIATNKSRRVSTRWIISLYLIHSWSGVPYETREMHAPLIFPRSKDKLPLGQMPLGDRIWLPRVLGGSYIHGGVNYDAKMNLEQPFHIAMEYKRLPWPQRR